jgi:hypothetical protein
VRVDDIGRGPIKEKCYVYVPDDPLMREVIQLIRDEQAPYVRVDDTRQGGGGDRDASGRIVPLNGDVVGARASELDGDVLDRDTTAFCEQVVSASRLAGRVTALEMNRALRVAEQMPRVATQPPPELTPREVEDKLSTEIQGLCNQIDRCGSSCSARRIGKSSRDFRQVDRA